MNNFLLQWVIPILFVSLLVYTALTEFGKSQPVTEPLTPDPVFIGHELKNEAYVFPVHNDTMTIRWVSDPVEVRKVLDEYWAETGKLATGLSITINDKCAIYAFEPEFENDRNSQILVHEFLHCMRGSYHE
jgi:hypothetical protein